MKCPEFDRDCRDPEWCQQGGPCPVAVLLDKASETVVPHD